MKQTDRISEQINLALGLNIFENTRTTKLVDARSLFCYILRKDLKMTLYQVRDIFLSKGKKFDHSTVNHNVKIYDEVLSRNKNFTDIRDEILGRISPKHLLIKKIESIDDKQTLINISNCVNSYE